MQTRLPEGVFERLLVATAVHVTRGVSRSTLSRVLSDPRGLQRSGYCNLPALSRLTVQLGFGQVGWSALAVFRSDSGTHLLDEPPCQGYGHSISIFFCTMVNALF